MKIKFCLLLLLIVSTLLSCDKDQQDDDVVCTMEFRTVTISVGGAALDSFYTVRQSNNDTIRISRENTPGGNTYPVLDDRFQRALEGRSERFIFHGIINGVITVREPFEIKADQCHIQYVSGRISI